MRERRQFSTTPNAKRQTLILIHISQFCTIQIIKLFISNVVLVSTTYLANSRIMKIQGLTIGLLSLLVFTSCSSIRNLSTKDSAAANTRLTKKKSFFAKREFLNQIEVTPGSVVPPNHMAATSSPQKKETTVRTIVSKPKTDEQIADVNIENLNMLQLKYAIVLDATAEKLTNVPLLEVIDKWWGTKYCIGGSTDNCIDCSAFTQIIMREVYQQTLPRTAQDQFNSSEKVELEDLREGDLVFFNTSGKDISHVGIYLLNNKFVHAATSGGVMISDLNDMYWQGKYRGAGRVGK